MTTEAAQSACPFAGANGIRKIHTPLGDEAWLVDDYHQVRHLFSDPNLGRSHPAPETAARVCESNMFFGGPVGDFDTEHEQHERLRGLLQPVFSPSRMRALRPRVEALTAELFDQMVEHGSPADFIAEIAIPLPLLIVGELLGIPREERMQFRPWSEAAVDLREGSNGAGAVAEMLACCVSLAERKRANPGDDVLSQMLARDDMSDEGAGLLAMIMLFAGHETSAVQIGKGALELLVNPEQRQLLAERPELIPNAAEELLRLPGIISIPRYTRTDMEIDGVPIAAGDLILLDLTAANHDSSVFSDPDRLDLTRREAAHLTFGYGSRYCIGAPLARIELQVVYGQLVSRFPTMRLAVDPSELRTRDHTWTGGLEELPVTW